MKKLYILLITFLPLLTYGQLTPTENYQYQVTYTTPVQDGLQDALSSDYKLQQVTYYDKMGRPKLCIAVQAGANKQNVFSHYEYDSFTGMQTKSYLPYATTPVNNLGYDSTLTNSNIASFYQTKYSQDFLNGVNPYSETVYEKSPIGNVVKQGAPGSDWKIGTDDTDHTLKMEYKSNIDNDVYAFDVVFTGGDFLQPTISYQGYYKRNELYLTITKNENWKPADGKLNTTETYKDKLGQTILVRTFDNIGGIATPHNLYNIYDDYGNLTFVLSPKATDALVVTPTTTYTNFSQNIPASAIITSPFNPTATAATISQTGLNQLSFNLNVSFPKGRTLKTGIIATLTATVPNCLLGYLTDGSYNYEVAIQDNKLVITNLAGINMPLGTAVNITLTTNLPTPSTLATLAPTLLDDLAYQYRYDYKNRAVEKKIPGKGWESFVYDNLNRPILSQDAKMKSDSEWLFVKYDNYGRVAYTGKYKDIINTTRVAIQQLRDNAVSPVLFESKITTPISIVGTNLYYTNTVFPSSNIDLFSINYYDNYVFDRDGITTPSTVYSEPVTAVTKALATGSKVRTLGTTNWTTTVMAYDAKARAIWTGSKDNYLETSDVLEAKLDFMGNPTETKTVHNKATVTTNLTTRDYFTYDHRKRLLKHTQQIGTNPSTDPIEVIANNTYDELGQLVQKKVGGIDGTTALQTVDYSFNVRGWLSKINDTNAMGTDLFAFEIKYNKPIVGATSLYDGNISQTLWRTANTDTALKQYNYSYDNLNRLKQAQFFSTAGTTTTANKYNESLNYDKNGNITTLNRSGYYTNTSSVLVWDEWLDNLNYTYQGNRLDKVADAGNKTEGFKDVTAPTDYTYDSNGNLITDVNKAISYITYNHFNQPLRITFSGTDKYIDFVYSASGTKLSKKINNEGTSTTTYYAGNYVYEKANSGIVTLHAFSHPEGYVAVSVTGYKYVYQYKDHLGNVRLSYTKNTAGALQIVEENHFYPFGVKHKGYNNGYPNIGDYIADKFKFNGQESEVFEGLNVTEMDYRQYDAALGRFYGLDLLAEATPWTTPNHFALNNPVIASDPTGLLIRHYSDRPVQQPSYEGGGGGFLSLFGGGRGFHDNLKNYDASGIGMGWGPGTGYSYVYGGKGGINPSGRKHIDGVGGHYETRVSEARTFSSEAKAWWRKTFNATLLDDAPTQSEVWVKDTQNSSYFDSIKDTPFFNNQYFSAEAGLRAGTYVDLDLKKIVGVRVGKYEEYSYKAEYQNYKGSINKNQNDFTEFSLAGALAGSIKYNNKKECFESFSASFYGFGVEYSKNNYGGYQTFLGLDTGASIGVGVGAFFNIKGGWIF